MESESLMALVEQFAEAADEHYDALEEMDEEEANRLAERLSSLYSAIIREGEEGREALLVLTDSSNPAIAGMAAVFSLRYDPPRCLQVLERLSRLPGLMGFRASIAIDRWRNGEWSM